MRADGVCSACGYNEAVELEIAAFMTPHIKRARYVLVGVGILYAYVGIRAYMDVSKIKEMLDAYGGRGDDPQLAELRHLVNVAYFVVVFTLGAGIANILLSAIAGKKTMLAFNLAAGLFLVHTGLLIYASHGPEFITSWVWWVTAIALGMGYQAARKAESLRNRPPGSGLPEARTL